MSKCRPCTIRCIRGLRKDMDESVYHFNTSLIRYVQVQEYRVRSVRCALNECKRITDYDTVAYATRGMNTDDTCMKYDIYISVLCLSLT